MNDETRAALLEELKRSIASTSWLLAENRHGHLDKIATVIMPTIDRIEQDAYARGQRDAYNDAAKDMKDMERDFRAEIEDAYREGAESGREW